MGVACQAGSEKIIHGLRCTEDHWMDEDFIIFKVDMRNPFNTLSRQVLPDECANCHGYRGVMGTIHVVAPSRRNPFRIRSTAKRPPWSFAVFTCPPKVSVTY